jgi:hypothetical protein
LRIAAPNAGHRTAFCVSGHQSFCGFLSSESGLLKISDCPSRNALDFPGIHTGNDYGRTRQLRDRDQFGQFRLVRHLSRRQTFDRRPRAGTQPNETTEVGADPGGLQRDMARSPGERAAMESTPPCFMAPRTQFRSLASDLRSPRDWRASVSGSSTQGSVRAVMSSAGRWAALRCGSTIRSPACPSG